MWLCLKIDQIEEFFGLFIYNLGAIEVFLYKFKAIMGYDYLAPT